MLGKLTLDTNTADILYKSSMNRRQGSVLAGGVGTTSKQVYIAGKHMSLTTCGSYLWFSAGNQV